LEKGGFTEALTALSLTKTMPLGFADEMRLGLQGTVRRVWGRRGVKVRQAVQFTYQWRYLFLAVDAPAGLLQWWVIGCNRRWNRPSERDLGSLCALCDSY
jgi:hypothetical protein